MHHIQNNRLRFTPLAIGVVIALIGGFFFIAPFLSVVGLAGLMAFLFYPTYQRLGRFIQNNGLKATLTLILSGLLVLVPLAIVVIITVSQLSSLAADASNYVAQNNGTLPPLLKDSVDTINRALAPLNNKENIITDQGVREFLRSTIPSVARTISTVVLGVVGNIPVAIVLTIMYIILFVEFLIDGHKIVRLLYRLSPLNTASTKFYLARIGSMTNAMAKGQLLISVIISFLSALLMIPLGLGDFFFLSFVVFTVLNLIPLGCGILFIPIIIGSILLGNVIPGILVLIAYMLVSNLDSIVRPKIMPKDAQLSAGLTMLAAFGGISAFGLLGVVYGPMLMIIIVTTIELYTKQVEKSAPKPASKTI